MTENNAASAFEVLRYRREDEVRIYSLRVIDGGAELWRVTLGPGQAEASIKEDDFTSADAAAQFFEEIERTLVAGGWRKSSESEV